MLLEVLNGEAGAASCGQHGVEHEAGVHHARDPLGHLGVREDRVKGGLV